MTRDLANHRSTVLLCAWALALSVGFSASSHAQPLQVGEAEPMLIETNHPYEARSTGVVWRRVVQWPRASYIALHFKSFDLAEGDYVTVSHPEGLRSVKYTGRGKLDLGSFWATHIPGDVAIVELHGSEGSSGFGFVIDQIAHGYPADELESILSSSVGNGPEAICGADDSDWAQCYQASHPDVYAKGRAVARLLIQATYLCTGWLVGAEGHLMTNNHCIADSSDANNTDFEFDAERSCGTNCSGSGACPGDVVASSATLVKTSDACDLDYTLVKLPVNPTSTYGFLTVSKTGILAGKPIAIVGHPGGGGKRISIFSSDPSDPNGVCTVSTLSAPRCNTGTCTSLGGPLEVGYMCDTEQGSSGSPVLRRGDNVVVALHHCANCPNRGEKMEAIVADLGSLLPPSAFPTPVFGIKEPPALSPVGLAGLISAVLSAGFFLLRRRESRR